ncbi:ABC transporter ATP-binding protein [Acidisoma cellulosilytica]|uniref:ABC transporter ATP-binding protein n=1 Tax=Acidisoma cellulosilyticum TaxID=2802395 RepID=A0A964E3X9_9PROT|nr:ABC transporter ATP-binding protein [Acidisoma cellulosilyticum]MCB8880697.1 ABC transporter ATP-binding protein [Acidisoma cellulosilyticum]
MTLLTVEGLRVGYGKVEVLHGIDVTVAPGEIVALLGSNGAGKTTTLRALSGLEPLRGGLITLDGAAIGGMPAHKIAALGLAHVPERRRLFAPLTVEENLKLGGYLIRSQQAELKRRIESMYALFPRLLERRLQLAGTLSGGEQQMVAIARALILQPKLLVLDEPSMGLAPLVVRSIFAIIKRLRDQGMGILLVEQNARQTLKIADRAYVLENGTIMLEGDAATLAQDRRVQAAYLGGAAAA